MYSVGVVRVRRGLGQEGGGGSTCGMDGRDHRIRRRRRCRRPLPLPPLPSPPPSPLPSSPPPPPPPLAAGRGDGDAMVDCAFDQVRRSAREHRTKMRRPHLLCGGGGGDCPEPRAACICRLLRRSQKAKDGPRAPDFQWCRLAAVGGRRAECHADPGKSVGKLLTCTPLGLPVAGFVVADRGVARIGIGNECSNVVVGEGGSHRVNWL